MLLGAPTPVVPTVAGASVLLLAVSSGVGCKSPPPAKAPEPEPEPEPVPEPEPPPPPKCEELAEGCKADAETRLVVPEVGLQITPPADWTYAKLEEAVAMEAEDGGPFLVVGSYPTEKKSMVMRRKPRSAAIARLAEVGGIEFPKNFNLGMKPDKTDQVGKRSMHLWQEEGKRGDQAGPVAVVAAEIDEREVVAVGYAPAGDKASPKQIIDTLKAFFEGEKVEEAAEAEGGEDAEL